MPSSPQSSNWKGSKRNACRRFRRRYRRAHLPGVSADRTIEDPRVVGRCLVRRTHRGLESRIVPKAGIPFATIELQGFKRSLSLSNVKTVTMFLGSIGKAKRLLRDFRPDVVVGTGGYVSAATVFAATRLHIPTVIHEQNSVAGVTNKFLARFVDKIAYAFPEVADTFPAKKLVQTGNPRAQQVAHLRPNNRLADFGLTPSERTLLIFGGSRGAPKINEAAIAALPTFAASHFQTLFVTGRVHYDAVIKAAGAVPDNVKIVPYVDDMPAILPDLTLVIGRSGATSLAELTALGVPAVLIPSPNVTGNHQFINAQSLAKPARRWWCRKPNSAPTLANASPASCKMMSGWCA